MNTYYFTFQTGIVNHGIYGTSIKIENCPDVKSGYNFLSKVLNPENTGTMNINHVPHLAGKICPLRTYQFKESVKTYSQIKIA